MILPAAEMPRAAVMLPVAEMPRAAVIRPEAPMPPTAVILPAAGPSRVAGPTVAPPPGAWGRRRGRVEGRPTIPPMRSRPAIRLAVCLAASVLLHLTVLWPAMGRALGSTPPGADDPPPPVAPPEPLPVEPGIDRSDAATLTWVGYEEYREHLARLAAVDQAAFTTAPGSAAAAAEAAGASGRPVAGGAAASASTSAALAAQADAAASGDAASEPVEPAEPAEPAESAEPVEPTEPADAAAAASRGTPETDATAAAGRPASEPVDRPPAPGAEPGAPDELATDVAATGSDAVDVLELARAPLEPAAEGPATLDRPALAEVVVPVPAPASPAPADGGGSPPPPSTVPAVPADVPGEAVDADADREAIAGRRPDPAALGRVLRRFEAAIAAIAPPTASAAPGGRRGDAARRSDGLGTDVADGESPPREGVVADRESPATSRIDVPREQLRPDRPIAREGLEIRPREPRFLSIERLTASPRNPEVRLVFGRDGVPVDAVLLVPTGDQRIDQAILSSLYRWRASGERLAALPEDGTLPLDFRIVLLGR